MKVPNEHLLIGLRIKEGVLVGNYILKKSEAYCAGNPVLAQLMRVPLHVSHFPFSIVLKFTRWIISSLQIKNEQSPFTSMQCNMIRWAGLAHASMYS